MDTAPSKSAISTGIPESYIELPCYRGLEPFRGFAGNDGSQPKRDVQLIGRSTSGWRRYRFAVWRVEAAVAATATTNLPRSYRAAFWLRTAQVQGGYGVS